jgi:hypothetical protein
MLPEARCAVAYVAGCLHSGQAASGVHDYDAGSHRSISGTVTPNHINVFDYGSGGGFITGPGSGSRFNLYHYGMAAHIELNSHGTNKYDGYDYKAGCHFSATVNDREISVYDYGAGKFFNYQLS